jgi:hypothetical protein
MQKKSLSAHVCLSHITVYWESVRTHGYLTLGLCVQKANDLLRCIGYILHSDFCSDQEVNFVFWMSVPFFFFFLSSFFHKTEALSWSWSRFHDFELDLFSGKRDDTLMSHPMTLTREKSLFTLTLKSLKLLSSSLLLRFHFQKVTTDPLSREKVHKKCFY